MNKKWVATIVVVIALIGGGAWYGINNTPQKKAEENKEVVKDTYNLTDEELEELDLSDEELEDLSDTENKVVKAEDVEKPSENSVEVENISGFKDSSKDTDDKSDKVGNLKLPYKVSGTDMVIENIGRYTGPFVEDGSDTPTANVISLVVKNNSSKVIQYGEINLKINDKDTITFKITNLPAKTSTLVMESTGKVEFSKDDTYKCLTPIQASLDSMTLMEDKVEIAKTEDGLISIKNKSNKDLDTVYVYYKYFQKGGVYLGGITYRVKFENVKAGETVEEKTSHYSKDFSEILMVDAVSN